MAFLPNAQRYMQAYFGDSSVLLLLNIFMISSFILFLYGGHMIVPLQFGKHSNYSFLYVLHSSRNHVINCTKNLGNAREQIEGGICITW